MEIRNLNLQDKNELLEIMTEFYNSPALLHHTPREVLSKVIDDCLSESPYVRCYVCHNGKIAAYTIVSVGYSTEYGGISVMIEDLYVCPRERGKGYATAILKYVEEQFKDKAVRLRLEVEKNNRNAIALYSRCGYSQIEYLQMGKLL